MTAKGGDTDIDLNGSLNKGFFRKRGLTINFEGDRPGASMFNEGNTLKKTKGGKLISNKATALDFSKGDNQVVDKKYLRKIKSSTPTMDHMMGTITGNKANYKQMNATTSSRGKEMLTSRHRKGFNATKKANQAERKADRQEVKAIQKQKDANQEVRQAERKSTKQEARKAERQEVKATKAANQAERKAGRQEVKVKKANQLQRREDRKAGLIEPKKGKGLGKIRQQERQAARGDKTKTKTTGKGKGLGKIRQQQRQLQRKKK